MPIMNRLLIRLWSVLEGEDAASINYQIAQTLVQNAGEIKHTSTSALAKLCNVSKPSISRFCKTIGYDDFYDFRAELNQFTPDRGSKYQTLVDPDAASWMTPYLTEVQKSAGMLQSHDIQVGIEALAADIRSYPHVYLVGNMQSGKTAESLHYNIHAAKKNIHAVTSWTERTQIFEEHKENSLFVIFSVEGEFFRALFPGGQVPPQSSTSKVWMVTTNPLIKKIDGIDEIINLKTGGRNIASGNICLEMAANLIALYYWQNCIG